MQSKSQYGESGEPKISFEISENVYAYLTSLPRIAVCCMDVFLCPLCVRVSFVQCVYDIYRYVSLYVCDSISRRFL